MTIARFYRMQAKPDGGDALNAVLAALADAVRALPGSEGVELMRDTADGERFVFIEKWTSIEAHKAAAAGLPKPTLTAVMEALAGAPYGSYLEYLKVV